MTEGSTTSIDYLSIKAELLCKGVIVEPETISDGLDPVDTSFVQGAVLKLDDGSIVNTSTWSWPPSADPTPRREVRPPRLFDDGSGLRLRAEGGECAVSILSLGAAGLRPLGNGLSVSDMFSLHNEATLFTAPVRTCIYIAIGQPCRFCTFDSGRVSRLPKDDFGQTLRHLLVRHPKVTSLAIGGGTPSLADMGARYYAGLAETAVALGLATSVEMVPPSRTSDLDLLVDAGVSSLIMSLEIWDDQLRGEWCLGKGSVERRQYFEAWTYALARLGPGRVSSVLLVGTEPLDSTLRGAESLIEAGIIPTLIPLRWYPESRYTDWRPVPWRDLLDVTSAVSALLTRAGLSPQEQPGCTACGGCSLEGSLVDLRTRR